MYTHRKWSLVGHGDWTVNAIEGAAYTVYVRLLLLCPARKLEVLSLHVQAEKVDLDSGRGGRLEPERVSHHLQPYNFEDGGAFQYGVKHLCGLVVKQAGSQPHADPSRREVSDNIDEPRGLHPKLCCDLPGVKSKVVGAPFPPSKAWSKCLLWIREGFLGHVVQFTCIDTIQIIHAHPYMHMGIHTEKYTCACVCVHIMCVCVHTHVHDLICVNIANLNCIF